MAAVAALSVIASLTTAASPAQALAPLPVPTPIIPAGTFGAGFPAFYTDAPDGKSLALCVDGALNCPAINNPVGSFNPLAGGEAFYYMAAATIPVTGGGAVDVEFAVEAGAPGGFLATFDRLRVRGDVAAGDYSLEHPYGSQALESVAGDSPSINFTDDVGCGAAPCDFNAATGGAITNFLRAANAPVGFLGDGATASTVTGATATDGVVPNEVPRNEVRLRNTATNLVVGSTPEFVITGQLVNGPTAAPSATALEFGNTASATRTLTVTNIGNEPLNLGAPAGLVAGGPFSVTSNTCDVPVASGLSCTVGLTYASAVANANANATLTMTTDTTAALPVSVRLHATSLAAASVTGGPLAFGANKVGTPSAAKTVTLTNTGVVPMEVGTATATGPFFASQTCGASLAVGANCAVSATYNATARGAQPGTLTIPHLGASGGTTSVALTGSGTTPNLALSGTALEFGHFRPGAVSPALTTRLTNTGDAVMVVGAASVTGPFAIASSDCPATLAPAGFCTVGVTFRPVVLGSAPGTLTLPNDPILGGAAQVALNGIGGVVAPAAPTGVQAVRGNRSARVSWVAPADNGGEAITAYDVFAISSSGAVRTVRVSGAVSSQRIGTLTNGTTYRFQVRAITVVGAGPRSAISAAVRPATKASAPRIRRATSGRPGGRATAKASWRAPRTNGGARVTGYRVVAQRMSARGRVLRTTTSGAIRPAARSATLRLRAGTYRFRVVAVNAVGKSARSTRSNAVRAR